VLHPAGMQACTHTGIHFDVRAMTTALHYAPQFTRAACLWNAATRQHATKHVERATRAQAEAALPRTAAR
jgi:hypothetical protein